MGELGVATSVLELLLKHLPDRRGIHGAQGSQVTGLAENCDTLQRPVLE
jgi:hypothetical protein